MLTAAPTANHKQVIMRDEDSMNGGHSISMHLQEVRNLSVLIHVLDENNRVIHQLHGVTESGSISINGDSAIRRTGTLELKMIEEMAKGVEEIIWIATKIAIYQGMRDNSAIEETYHYWLLGTFYVTEENVSISPDRRMMALTLQDRMTMIERKQIDHEMHFEPGTPITSIIIMLLEEIGEFQYFVQHSTNVIPFTLEYQTGTTVMSILEQLRDFYMDHLFYYNRMGRFIFRRYEIQRPFDMPISWVFEGNRDLRMDYSFNANLKEVRNQVTVTGQTDDFGRYPRSVATIENEKSPFHRDKPGMGIREYIIEDTNLRTELQCDARARFELFRRSNRQEVFECDTIPIYFLNTNEVIKVPHEITGELEFYEITALTIPLDHDGTSRISSRKVYFNHGDISSEYEEYANWARTFTDSILRFGWIRNTEEMAIRAYGITTNNRPLLIVNYEFSDINRRISHTTNWTENTSQSIMINIFHFTNMILPSGTTDVEHITADRVLAKMICLTSLSNFWGSPKFRNVPRWFRYGLAEMITGADEKVKAIIANNNRDGIASDRLQTLIDRILGLWDGGVAGLGSIHGMSPTDNLRDEAASYLLVKIILRNLDGSTNVQNLIRDIDDSRDLAMDILPNALLRHMTTFGSRVEIRAFIAENIEQMITNIPLNWDGFEIDTGSIFGSQETGGPDLCGETVVDNEVPAGQEHIISNVFEIEIRPGI